MKTPAPSREVLRGAGRILAATAAAAGVTALAACSGTGSGSPAPQGESTAASAPAPAGTATARGGDCIPMTTIRGIIDTSQGTPIYVFGGYARFNGQLVAHPVELFDGKQWDFATLQQVGATAWEATEEVPVQQADTYVRGQTNAANDGCVVLPGVARPAGNHTQAVTATGTVEYLPDGNTYAGYGYGFQSAASPAAVYTDGGIAVPVAGVPADFYQGQVAQKAAGGQ